MKDWRYVIVIHEAYLEPTKKSAMEVFFAKSCQLFLEKSSIVNVRLGFKYMNNTF